MGHVKGYRKGERLLLMPGLGIRADSYAVPVATRERANRYYFREKAKAVATRESLPPANATGPRLPGEGTRHKERGGEREGDGERERERMRGSGGGGGESALTHTGSVLGG